MARHKMDDGTIVDTDKARQNWDEATRWDGRNHISVNTGSQWDHEELYLSAKGRYYIRRWSDREGLAATAEFVTPQEAAAWLVLNQEELPEDLKEFEAEVSE